MSCTSCVWGYSCYVPICIVYYNKTSNILKKKLESLHRSAIVHGNNQNKERKNDLKQELHIETAY